MRIARAAFLASLALSSAAHADVVSQHPDSTAVTFYHDNAINTATILHPDQNPWVRSAGFAFITETRTIDLPAGPSIVKFEDVASTMVPQTADIAGLPAGVLERNFDYDLLSPGSLLAKSIGQTIRLVRTDPKTGRLKEESAIVRSGPNGAILEIDGIYEALRCSGLPEKLVFDRVPDGLTDTPTLTVRTLAPVAGHYTVTLSYIATGLNWSADYVARIAPDSNTLDLSGWLTLANFSTTNFQNAPVDVIAGKLQTTGDDQPVDASAQVLATNCWPTNIDWATHHYPPPQQPPPPPSPALMARLAGDNMEMVVQGVPVTKIEARALGDYKLYPLPEPTTVAAQQTKQIQFLDQSGVPFERIYRYSIDGAPNPEALPKTANVILRLQNRADKGLGKPLPAGDVSVFAPGSNGSFVFAGQHSVDDISVGLPVEVEIGRSMDVRIVPRLADSTTTGSGRRRKAKDSWEVTIENDKKVPIAFELRQDIYGGEAQIVSETKSHKDVSGRAVWSIPLTPGERTMLRYTIEHPAR
jgi:hypothetical protein